MGTQEDVLKILAAAGGPLTEEDLVRETGSTSGVVRKQLSRLKQGNLIDGNAKDGWFIVDEEMPDADRKAHTSIVEEGVSDYDKFIEIGQRIGINKLGGEGRLSLLVELVWSGNYRDLTWVQHALSQAGIRQDLAGPYLNFWAAYLKQSIPPELAEIMATGQVEKEQGTTSKSKGEREYIIFDDEPRFVGSGRGDFSLEDAKEILALRSLKSRFQPSPTQQANPPGGATMSEAAGLIGALEPYINKDTDSGMLREITELKLNEFETKVRAMIPQSQPQAPRSFMEELGGLIAQLSSLREVGPILRELLGIPAPSQTPPSPTATMAIPNFQDSQGNPIFSNIEGYITLDDHITKKKREEESHQDKLRTGETVRKELPRLASALTGAARKRGWGDPQKSNRAQCLKCGAIFEYPEGATTFTCPNCQTSIQLAEGA